MIRQIFPLLLLGVIAFPCVHAAATLEDVERSFRPYKDGFPQIAGIKPGMVITASNVDQAKEVLDPELYQHIKDGWVEITVGETTDFILHENYIQASKDNLNQTSLGDQPGAINGFIAGRPLSKSRTAMIRVRVRNWHGTISTAITGGITRQYIHFTGALRI